jgi:GalNAc5-diNAcBac-PP-undecaprenol beta-1,3-glucosyltransferase
MNQKSLPTVSIIITTCNRLELFKRALLSVQNQDYKNLVEIIVTDDSSNTETEEYISEISKQDPRVRYIKNTTYQKGPGGNKQNGFDVAKGDFIGNFDDDDELLPTAISDLMDVYLRLGYRHIMANCLLDNGSWSGKHYGVSESITYQDILTEKYRGGYWGIFARDLMKDYKMADDAWGGESILWWHIFKQEPAYYLHKIVHIYHDQVGGNVSANYINHTHRTFLSFKYKLDYFGDDLLRYAPFQYERRALAAAFFASLDFDYKNALKYSSLAWMHSKKNLFLVAFTAFILIPLPKIWKGKIYECAKRRYLKS